MEPTQMPSDSSTAPRWQPLSAIQRRVLGVLVEKAKTTPDAYPLTLNSLRNGCNQKSNRHPKTDLEPDQIEDALEELRQLGAVSVIQGDGRVEKYRHLAYAWLGVDKVELAVMAELLLRGAQTVGELRGRAARMEPISGLAELQPILEALIDRQLLVRLTPAGRGCVVSHTLYQPAEEAKVRAEFEGAGAPDRGPPPTDRDAAARPVPSSAATEMPAAPVAAPETQSASTSNSVTTGEIAVALADLRQQVSALERQVAESTGQLRRELDDVRRQLGM